MRVRQQYSEDGSQQVELLDEAGEPIEVVSGFLRFLAARACSPNTLVSYAYDLRHLWRFFDRDGLTWEEFAPRHSIALLEYLRSVPSRRPRQRMTLTVVVDADGPATKLAASTVNRILAAVSSFYEYVILAGLFERLNPIEKRPDPALARVSERHRPFMGRASRQRPIRRAVRVKTVQRVPRPLSEAQVAALLEQLRSKRDRAIVLLMLQGGLRPGEVLGLHLEDLAYGRRRWSCGTATITPRAPGPSLARRVVDLHEPETLAMLSAYVLDERPTDADSPLVFLIGGGGKRRLEALGYDGLAKMFTRATTRAGIRTPWVTPHACRHTHATAMWEGGMRELTLQKRLGHASPESTRIYTRVSDPAVVADYNRALGRPSAPTASRPDGRSRLGRRARGDLGHAGWQAQSAAPARVRIPRLRLWSGRPPRLPQPEDPLLPRVQGRVAEDGRLVRRPAGRAGRAGCLARRRRRRPTRSRSRPGPTWCSWDCAATSPSTTRGCWVPGNSGSMTPPRRWASTWAPAS